MIAKVIWGAGVCLVAVRVRSGRLEPTALSVGWPLALAVVGGVVTASVMAAMSTHWARTAHSRPAERPGCNRTSTQDLDRWLGDDQPISGQSENLLPEHLDVANRIGKRLVLESASRPSALPGIAIVGPYGSGKTSLSSIVRSLCENRRASGRKLPAVLFCRFEAWQYVSGEAAVRGLIDAATNAILAVADVPELWRLPDEYVSAIKEGGSTWSRAVASLIGRRSAPGIILGIIGQTLERLNLRLLLIVDDLDRIEETSPQSSIAMTEALNLLQDVPNVQYLVTVGPMRVASEEGAVRARCDLLKLTRFQELVPRLEPETTISLVRQCRDRALADDSAYYPWAEMPGDEKDPLSWKRLLGSLNRTGLSAAIIELLDTPRALKCALRETHAAWNGGLRGEINWYHLLLTSALRVAEPGLFEWIERSRDLFVHGSDRIDLTNRNSEQQKVRSDELKAKVLRCLRRQGEERQIAVLSALRMLFPSFASQIDGVPGSRDPAHLTQGIGYCPPWGRPYLERFLSGCLAEGEPPDQPTLQAIRRIQRDGVEPSVFTSMYLGSVGKLTGPLNKFVQFSGLLSLERALEVCDVIVSWAAQPGQSELWATPWEFYIEMMGDVLEIISRSDARRPMRYEDRRKREAGRQAVVLQWLESKIDQHAGAWRVPDALLECLDATVGHPISLLKEVHLSLCQRLSERLRGKYVGAPGSLLGAVRGDRFALHRFLSAVRGTRADESFTSRMTTWLVSEADADETHELKGQILFCLCECRYPVSRSKPPVEAYTFSVNPAANERTLDMEILRPALARWAGMDLPDLVAKRALGEVTRAYEIGRTEADGREGRLEC